MATMKQNNRPHTKPGSLIKSEIKNINHVHCVLCTREIIICRHNTSLLPRYCLNSKIKINVARNLGTLVVKTWSQRLISVCCELALDNDLFLLKEFCSLRFVRRPEYCGRCKAMAHQRHGVSAGRSRYQGDSFRVEGFNEAYSDLLQLVKFPF